jgi:cell division protein FtsI/penicillin-binding protein 2
MTRTMTDGTGKGSQLDGYTSAGKTGTAEKLVNGRYSNDHNVGSFVGWAPASPGVRAELVCLFVTDDPTKNGRFGSQVAAPYAARILQGALERMGVPKQADAPVAKEAR